jgi:hypothetical protein
MFAELGARDDDGFEVVTQEDRSQDRKGGSYRVRAPSKAKQPLPS